MTSLGLIGERYDSQYFTVGHDAMSSAYKALVQARHYSILHDGRLRANLGHRR